MPEDDQPRIILGRISGVFGVKGWLKVFSETAPRDNILGYPVWQVRRRDGWRDYRLLEGQPHGKGIIARLAGVDDRDQAAELTRCAVAVGRDELPPAPVDEYYWADLEGLAVVNLDGVGLGRVDHLFETGANDVMALKGERDRLLPFIAEVVREVDLEAGRIEVDWDPDF